MLNYFHDSQQYGNIVYIIGIVIVTFNSCVNPFVYVFVNERFRNHLKRLFRLPCQGANRMNLERGEPTNDGADSSSQHHRPAIYVVAQELGKRCKSRSIAVCFHRLQADFSKNMRKSANFRQEGYLFASCRVRDKGKKSESPWRNELLDNSIIVNQKFVSPKAQVNKYFSITFLYCVITSACVICDCCRALLITIFAEMPLLTASRRETITFRWKAKNDDLRSPMGLSNIVIIG